jgi:molybdate transport system substrate-binding protein
MMKRSIFVLLCIFICGGSAVFAQEGALIVFAAASLTDAFEEIAAEFEAANPDVEVLFNFGSSSDLAAQLSEGAPADVFASANNRQMNVAVEAERIAGDPVVFVQNRLILIVPFDNPAEVEGLASLASESVQLVVAALGVPVRDYTDTMLEALAADACYGEAYREAVLANIVSEEQNVRQVSAKVALGEADAGIVYASDVTPDIADDVIAFAIPDAVNTIASYPIAVTNDSTSPELAQAFVDYVLSEDGQAIMATWGFIPMIETEVENTPEITPEATVETTADC